MGEPKSIIPFIVPKFNWQADNLYAHFQIFKDKVTFAFDGQFKEANKESKCGAILNWMGDEAFPIYHNLPISADDKKDPKKLLDGFLDYFKPEQNVYQSWYTLGSLYSGQFKSQGDFYNKLQQVVCECSFTNADEVVKFLFLTHNQDKRVHEDLLKQMKETTTLSDMVRIAKTTESMVHSETLSTQYLETVKSTKTIEAVKCDGSRNRNKGQQQNRSRSNSSHQHPPGSCGNCGYKHPPRKCKAYKKECYKCGKEGHFAPLCHSRPKSTSRSTSSTQKGNGKPQQHQS